VIGTGVLIDAGDEHLLEIVTALIQSALALKR
jgi:hypothetical protein